MKDGTSIVALQEVRPTWVSERVDLFETSKNESTPQVTGLGGCIFGFSSCKNSRDKF